MCTCNVVFLSVSVSVCNTSSPVSHRIKRSDRCEWMTFGRRLCTARVFVITYRRPMWHRSVARWYVSRRLDWFWLNQKPTSRQIRLSIRNLPRNVGTCTRSQYIDFHRNWFSMAYRYCLRFPTEYRLPIWLDHCRKTMGTRLASLSVSFNCITTSRNAGSRDSVLAVDYCRVSKIRPVVLCIFDILTWMSTALL